MRIVALTDIHGAYRQAEKIIRSEKPELVIVGGDLTTVGSIQKATEAINLLQSIAPYLLCVAGNMDLPQHDELFDQLGVSINGRGVRLGHIGFFGVSGAPISLLHTPYEITEQEIAKRIDAGFSQVRHCMITVFVPHAPPYGTKLDIIHAGIHVGSTAVREFIEEHEPNVVVCGHIHEARGKDILRRSTIINCGSAGMGNYGLITIDDAIDVECKHQ